MSSIVPWTNPGGAPCCCVLCDVPTHILNNVITQLPSIPLTRDQFFMFKGGGQITISSFSISGELTYARFDSLNETTVSYAGTAAPMSSNGPEAPNDFCYLTVTPPLTLSGQNPSGMLQPNVEVPNAAKSIYGSNSTVAYTSSGVWLKKEIGPRFITQLFPFTPFRFEYLMYDQNLTINGTTSSYWMFYNITVGIYVFIYRPEFITNEPDFAVARAALSINQFVGGTTEEGLYAYSPTGFSTTGQQINNTLITPLGNFSMPLFDASNYNVKFPYESRGTPTMSWASYPTFTWAPFAP